MPEPQTTIPDRSWTPPELWEEPGRPQHDIVRERLRRTLDRLAEITSDPERTPEAFWNDPAVAPIIERQFADAMGDATERARFDSLNPLGLHLAPDPTSPTGQRTVRGTEDWWRDDDKWAEYLSSAPARSWALDRLRRNNPLSSAVRDQYAKVRHYYQLARNLTDDAEAYGHRNLIANIPDEDRDLFLSIVADVNEIGTVNYQRSFSRNVAHAIFVGRNRAHEAFRLVLGITPSRPEPTTMLPERSAEELVQRRNRRGDLDDGKPWTIERIRQVESQRELQEMAARGTTDDRERDRELFVQRVYNARRFFDDRQQRRDGWERGFYNALGMTPDLVATAATAMFTGGAGAVAYWMARGGGDYYREAREMGASHDNAQITSSLLAGPNALIEFAQDGLLVGRGFASGLLGSLKRNVLGLVPIMAGRWTVETAEEAGQALLEMAQRAILENVDPNVAPANWREVWQNKFEEVREAAYAMPWLLAPGAVGQVGQIFRPEPKPGADRAGGVGGAVGQVGQTFRPVDFRSELRASEARAAREAAAVPAPESPRQIGWESTLTTAEMRLPREQARPGEFVQWGVPNRPGRVFTGRIQKIEGDNAEVRDLWGMRQSLPLDELRAPERRSFKKTVAAFVGHPIQHWNSVSDDISWWENEVEQVGIPRGMWQTARWMSNQFFNTWDRFTAPLVAEGIHPLVARGLAAATAIMEAPLVPFIALPAAMGYLPLWMAIPPIGNAVGLVPYFGALGIAKSVKWAKRLVTHARLSVAQTAAELNLPTPERLPPQPLEIPEVEAEQPAPEAVPPALAQAQELAEAIAAEARTMRDEDIPNLVVLATTAQAEGYSPEEAVAIARHAGPRFNPPPLTPDETQRRAEAEAVEQNMGMIEGLGRRFANRTGRPDKGADYTQVASMAFVEAMRSYNPAENADVPFEAYAAQQIGFALEHASRREHVIRRPRDTYRWIEQAAEYLRQRLYRNPTDEEIADRLNESGRRDAGKPWTEDRVYSVRSRPLRAEPEEAIGGLAAPGRGVGEIESDDAVENIADCIQSLPEDERRVMRLIAFEHKSHADIARDTGWTQRRVKELARRGREQLRELLAESLGLEAEPTAPPRNAPVAPARVTEPAVVEEEPDVQGLRQAETRQARALTDVVDDATLVEMREARPSMGDILTAETGRALRQRLHDAVTPNQRLQWFRSPTELNEDGKTAVQRALRVKALGDEELASALEHPGAATMAALVDDAVPELVAARQARANSEVLPDYDIVRALGDAIRYWRDNMRPANEAITASMKFADSPMVSPPIPHQAGIGFSVIDQYQGKPAAFREFVDHYAGLARETTQVAADLFPGQAAEAIPQPVAVAKRARGKQRFQFARDVPPINARTVARSRQRGATYNEQAVIATIERLFGILVRRKFVGRGAQGLAVLWDRIVRLTGGNLFRAAIGVTCHEIAHIVDEILNLLDTAPDAVLAELAQLDYDPEAARPSEGLAEFFRFILTDTDLDTGASSMEQEAPATWAWFQQRLGQNAVLRGRMAELEKVIRDYRNQDAAERGAAMLRPIGSEPARPVGETRWERLKQWLDRTWRWNVYQNFDRYSPMKRYDALAEQMAGRPLDVSESVYRYLSANTMQAARHGREAAENGAFDPLTGERLGPGLIAVFDAGEINTDADLKAFARWLYASHAIEELGREQPRDPGISLDEAQAMVEENARPTFDEARRVWDKMWDGMLEMRRRVGLLTDVEVARIKAAMPRYVPMMRIVQKGKARRRRGAIFGDRSDVQYRYGSRLEVVNPLEQTVDIFTTAYERAHRQIAHDKIVGLQRKFPGLGEFVTELPQPPVKRVLSGEELGEIFARAGFEIEDRESDEAQAFADVYRADTRTREADRVAFSLVSETNPETGEVTQRRAWFQYGDDGTFFWEALQNLDQGTQNIFLKIMGYMTWWVKAGAVVFKPAFWVMNSIRDYMTYMIQREHAGFFEALIGAFPMVGISAWRYGGSKILRALGFEGSPFVRFFEMAGGETSSLLGASYGKVRRTVSDIMRSRTARGRFYNAIRPRNWLRTARDMAQFMGNVSESASRLTEGVAWMKRHGMTADVLRGRIERGETMTEEERIHISEAIAEATVNFKRAGRFGRGVNMVVPFWNPSIQGLNRAVRMGREHPWRLAMWSGLMMASTIGYWMQVKDDDDYDEMEAWLKYGFWHFGNVRIPIPFEYGWVTKALTEALLNTWNQHDPRSLGEWLSEAYENLSPISLRNFPLGMVNVAGLSPLIESRSNRWFFGDRPIESRGMEGLPPHERYTERNSRLIRYATDWLASGDRDPETGVEVSPAKIEHFLNATTGGLVPRILRLIENLGGLADHDLGDVTGLSSLLIRNRSYRSVTDFYEARERASQAYTSWNRSEAAAAMPPDVYNDNARAQDVAELLSELRVVERERKTAMGRFEINCYTAGLARWALGRRERGDYPNPLRMDHLPDPVADIVEAKVGQWADAASDPDLSRRGEYALAILRSQIVPVEDTINCLMARTAEAARRRALADGRSEGWAQRVAREVVQPWRGRRRSAFGERLDRLSQRLKQDNLILQPERN